MTGPPRWTREQLQSEVRRARTLFRRERLDEPLERWKNTFDLCRKEFCRLFVEYGIADPASLGPDQIADIFRNDLGDALRYLAGPPISADDLKVLADASLAPGRIAADPSSARRILDIITQAIDPRRFPWVAEDRPPTEQEKSAAILASAALTTAQRVSTARRSEGKDAQERLVKQFLRDMDFQEVPAHDIHTLTDAPDFGHFCGEALVGSRKADISVRLFDGRLMPIECKVSNSATNSVKRINNDAQVKAAIWHREFGTNQVVPCAVLSGVYKVHNLMQAQAGGLTLFWAHELSNMRDFIKATRSE